MVSSRAEEANLYGKYDRKGPKPEELGRRAVRKDESPNAPRKAAPKKKKPSGGGGGALPKKAPTPPSRNAPGQSMAGTETAPSMLPATAPTPTPRPQLLPGDNAPIPPSKPQSFAGTETAPPAPFMPPMNPALSQASILQTPPPELTQAPGMSMAGQERAPYPAPQVPGMSFAGQEGAPPPLGMSFAGQEGAPPNPFGVDPKDILSQLLMQSIGGAAPGQRQDVGALGLPKPKFPGFGG